MNKSNLKPINVSDQNIAACNDLGKCKIYYKTSATKQEIHAVLKLIELLFIKGGDTEAQLSALENQLYWYKPLVYKA